jgi:hypothetical protein
MAYSIFEFWVLRVPPIQISTQNGGMKVLFNNFHRGINLVAHLFSYSGFRVFRLAFEQAIHWVCMTCMVPAICIEVSIGKTHSTKKTCELPTYLPNFLYKIYALTTSCASIFNFNFQFQFLYLLWSPQPCGFLFA